MAQDPFPMTSDAVTEHRFSIIFQSLSTIEVLPDNPYTPREGQVWFNKNTGKVCLFINGAIKHLKLED